MTIVCRIHRCILVAATYTSQAPTYMHIDSGPPAQSISNHKSGGRRGTISHLTCGLKYFVLVDHYHKVFQTTSQVGEEVPFHTDPSVVVSYVYLCIRYRQTAIETDHNLRSCLFLMYHMFIANDGQCINSTYTDKHKVNYQ